MASLTFVNLLVIFQSVVGLSVAATEQAEEANGYKLQIAMHHYENPRNVDFRGNNCDGIRNFGSSPCDPYFNLAVWRDGKLSYNFSTPGNDLYVSDATVLNEDYFRKLNQTLTISDNFTRNSTIMLGLGAFDRDLIDFLSDFIASGVKIIELSTLEVGKKQIITMVSTENGILMQLSVTAECLPGACGALCQWPVGFQYCNGSMLTCAEKSVTEDCRAVRGNFAYHLKLMLVPNAFYHVFNFSGSDFIYHHLILEVCMRGSSENCTGKWKRLLSNFYLLEIDRRQVWFNSKFYDYYREVDMIEPVSVISIRLLEHEKTLRLVSEFGTTTRFEAGSVAENFTLSNDDGVYFVAEYKIGCRDGYQGDYCDEPCLDCLNYDPLSRFCRWMSDRGPWCAYLNACFGRICSRDATCALLQTGIGEAYKRFCCFYFMNEDSCYPR